jgi:hypothetical protein
MEHHRLRKYRGPETWRRVREAYIAGESGPSVARRFDVGLANLRRRAIEEGWTRKAIAARIDLKPLRGEPDAPGTGITALSQVETVLPDVPPRDALFLAVRRASALLAQGQAGEAAALLRAAEALERLSWAGV